MRFAMRRPVQIFGVIVLLLLAYPLSYLVLLDPQVHCFTSANAYYSRSVSFRGFGPSYETLQVFYKPLIEFGHKYPARILAVDRGDFSAASS
jgi:hypothetical protein